MLQSNSTNGTRKAHEEHQYLSLIQNIIEKGEKRADRTGTGTVSVFAPPQLRFSLQDDIFPLLTTKRVFWRAVAEELLWFIKGDTNSKHLSEKGIKIWDGNGSREYLDSIGLSHREEGDLGPVYGFQWRHFGAEYIDCKTDYTGKGVDQLQEVIDKIKNKPTDRRIIMSAWNPADIPIMALPPCHAFCQFYVSTPTEEEPIPRLSCLLYQRSCDMGLGVPFNIASYALLTRLIAQVTGLLPGEFIHTMGDAHVYVDHIEALKEQIQREPRSFPKLRINPDVTNIDDFKYEDFVLEDYKPHGKLDMKMSV
ncbi:thymidylate synthase [Umbelopsis sp. AD052]|nr:thymidylate synthase [Umbelopsis sp. AD052]